jgi:hypothetical protein
MPTIPRDAVLSSLEWPFLLSVLALAFFWAKLEIEIEGPDGWAARLPTWRVKKPAFADVVLGGGDITGYHVWAFAATLAFFHLKVLGRWTWASETRVLGAFVLFWLLEDVLWFALNPHYGWRALTPGRAGWHRRWFCGLPVPYWIMGPLGVFLYILPLFL